MLGSKFKDGKIFEILTISRLVFKSTLSTILHSLQEFNFKKGRAHITMKGNSTSALWNFLQSTYALFNSQQRNNMTYRT
jgi:hypothetical protein